MSTWPAAYGIYGRNVVLPDVVSSLNRAGFENEDICMVLSPHHPVAAAMRDANIVNAEREESASSARVIGWFSELGAVVIPTVGFFIRSLEFFHALVADRASSAMHGESGTLVRLGFSEKDAERLGHQLSEVGVLVYVSCRASAGADRAIELLCRTGAGEVASLARADAAEAVA
jgi:hypothetical protein